MIDKETRELAERMIRWIDKDPCASVTSGELVLKDALRQATLPATVIWLAEIARRYGFEPEAPDVSGLT